MTVNSKCSVLFALFAACAPFIARAQDARDMKLGNVDYPSPTPFAMYALERSNVATMETGTVRDFSGTVLYEHKPGRHQDGPCVAIEIAPFMIGSSINLSDYLVGRLQRVLMRMRISAAMDMTSDAPNMALGLRFMLHDDADIRSDSLFQRRLAEWGTAISPAPPASTEAATLSAAHSIELKARIDSLRTEMMSVLWNRSVVEIGLGTQFTNDNTVKFIYDVPLQPDEFGSYYNKSHYYASAVAGIPFWRQSGQLIISGSVAYAQRVNGFTPVWNGFLLRSVLGTSRQRGWMDFQVMKNEDESDLRIGFGGTLCFGSGIGLTPMLSISLLSRHEAFASFRFSFATPQL